MYVCMHVHIYIYIYIYTILHTYLHAYNSLSGLSPEFIRIQRTGFTIISTTCVSKKAQQIKDSSAA